MPRHEKLYGVIRRSHAREVTRYADDQDLTVGVHGSLGNGDTASCEVTIFHYPDSMHFVVYRRDESGRLAKEIARWSVPTRTTPFKG